MTDTSAQKGKNNPMRPDATKPDAAISYRRLKAFCDASEFDDADVIMSHSQYSDDLSTKGKVNLVFGDIKSLLAAIIQAEEMLLDNSSHINACADENESLRASLGHASRNIERLSAENDHLRKLIVDYTNCHDGNPIHITSQTLDGVKTGLVVDETQSDEVYRLRAALEEISSPTQTADLLWWQIKAREALKGGAQPRNPEASDQPCQIRPRRGRGTDAGLSPRQDA